MFDTTKVAKRIKEARVAQNLTQMQLADAMGVSYQAVSNWERGNSMPDISKLEDLSTSNPPDGGFVPAVRGLLEQES